MTAKPKDRTTLYILLICGGGASLVVLGIAIEVLKLIALVKWIFA